MDSRDITDVAARLAAGVSTCVVTGAGVSAESGVPTFRGEGGLWREHRAEDLATPEAFARDPQLVWEWYAWRRETIAACAPNRAHQVLAGWSRSLDDFVLVTQNVDGLHERAGTAGVVRFHGSIWEVSCRDGCAASPPRWWEEEAFSRLPPTCPHCGGLLRPGVVWFGEGIDGDVLRQSVDAADRCELFLVVGTSSVVHPAAGLVDRARAGGAFTVEVNSEATPATGLVDLALTGRAEDVLDRIERAREALGGG